MFKLVVLLAAVAMAVAEPSVYASSLAYETVVPAVDSVSSLYAPYNVYNTVPSYGYVRSGYVPQYYNQPGLVEVPVQPQVFAGAAPYFAGGLYHPLFKRSSEKSN